MKINIDYLDNQIILNDNSVNSVEVENKKYFYRIVNDLYDIYTGNISEFISFFSSEDKELTAYNKIKIFINYFDFGFETKKVLNDISKFVNQNISEEEKLSITKDYQKLLNTYKKILNNIDLPIKINEDINYEDITKLIKLGINYNNNILENILLLIDIEKTLGNNNILVFINLKQYLSSAELNELYKYSLYNNIKILLLDSQLYSDKLYNEKKLIIYENLDEFVV